jgi:hypothetical protein
MTLAGAVLALGGNTPVGDLLVHLPLFGSQRLPSRNILVADLALAVLLAYWADRPLSEGRRRFLPVRRRGPDLETVLAVLPSLAVIAAVALGLSWGAGLLHWLRVSPGAPGLDGSLKPWLIPYGLLGVVAVAPGLGRTTSAAASRGSGAARQGTAAASQGTRAVGHGSNRGPSRGGASHRVVGVCGAVRDLRPGTA